MNEYEYIQFFYLKFIFLKLLYDNLNVKQNFEMTY